MTISNIDENTLGKRLGTALKQLRSSRQLSLEAFSKQVGISKLTLINIEKGEANPTLSVIWKIANGLGVPITQLLSLESNAILSKHDSGLKIFNDLEDAVFIAEPMFEARGSSELYKGYLKANSTYLSDAHAANVVEFITVLTGELILEVDSIRYPLKCFDAIKFQADRPHTYINPTNESVLLHFVISYSTL